MFRVKPNYFVSIQDKGIQNTIVLRIQTQNIKIGGIHNDLRISWKAVHQLTSDTTVKTKNIDPSIIELYEPKSFETEIQPQLLNWKDLSLPKEWLFEEFTGEGHERHPKPIEFQASGNTLYFRDTRLAASRKSISYDPGEGTSGSKDKEPIGIKTVQFSVLPGSRKLEEQKSIRFEQMEFDPETIFFSYNQNKRRYCYIEITFEFLGYKPYSLHALIDTGATSSVCQPNAIPKELWQRMKNPIASRNANNTTSLMEYKAKDIPFIITTSKGKRTFRIPKLLCFPHMHGDIILGNNFLSQYFPISITNENFLLTDKKKSYTIPWIQSHLFICNKDFAPVKRDDNSPILDIEPLEIKELEKSH